MLSDGLEGRSNNPVALLVDTLLRPDADMGESEPSSLCWFHDPSRAVSHVVVGRGNPGGCWQFMEPNTRTLSLAEWLDLPLYSFQDWQRERAGVTGSEGGGGEMNDSFSKRALSGEIATYYADYVTKMGLEGNFVNSTEVHQTFSLEEKVFSVSSCGSASDCSSPQSHPSPASPTSTSSPSSPSSPSSDNIVATPTSWDKVADVCSQIYDPEDCGVFCCDERRKVSKFKWYLRGTQAPSKATSSKVCIFSQKLVLACGIHGNPRCVGVPGEDADFLVHSLPEFSQRVSECCDLETALVVGDGLSAADAVMLALKKGLRVVHVLQKDPFDKNLIFSRMPETVYPDYKRVHRLMQGKDEDQKYCRFLKSRISEFRTNGFTVVGESGEEERLEGVAVGCVLFGTNAELGFLPETIVSKLGMEADQPINAKHNPINVNPISFVSEASSSLYTIGSLTGDNFVRFGVGSALGAAQHIITNFTDIKLSL